MTALLAFIPLFISMLVTLTGWRLRPDRSAELSRRGLRSAWLAAGSITLLCSLADWLLLASLPRLKLSFGPIALPLALFNSIRMGLLVLTLPAIFLAGSIKQRKTVAAASSVVQVILLALAFDSLYVEPFRLGVMELPVPGPAFLGDRPLRILQLSDLHVERLTKREREMLARVNALQPDLIVLTGDFVNLDYVDDPLALQETHDLLSQLNPPYGVYAVTGTTDTAGVKAAVFEGLDIRLMDDKLLTISFPGGDLSLVGVADTHDWGRDKNMLEILMAGVPAGSYTLLLYHTPDLIQDASAAGVDLYLAGHTHGGQVRLPFYGAMVTFSHYGKRYEMGRYVVGPTILYVSRGIGMEGWGAPRMRFLCPPEMVLVELGK